MSSEEDLQQSIDELDESIDDQHSDEQSLSQQHQDEQGLSEQSPQQQPNTHHTKPVYKDYYAEYLGADEDVENEPPLLVVVQGSSASGKSSVIRSLVKHFTKYKVDQIIGSITLRTTKKQRITIRECDNDLLSMVDLSKVADIVILVIDASLGFEMETFEFLSLLKGHGFPHVIGVLTHLDYFKENKQMRKAKKRFKKRFEYQIGGNYKLISLTKWENGLYPKIQSAKLARYVCGSKGVSIPWRKNHPYILVDRWQTYEDKNYQADDLLSTVFYGYIRGSSYRLNSKIHIVGVGDYQIESIEPIMDPCPQYKKGEVEDDPDQIEEEGEKKQSQITKKKKKRRTLNQNQRLIFAPACNLGTINLEHTSGYVTIPHDYVKFTRLDGEDDQAAEEGVQLVRDLQNLKESINVKRQKMQNEFELLEGVQLEEDMDEEHNSQDKQFRNKKNQIRRMQKQTENLLIPMGENGQFHQRYDIYQLTYESKEKMITHDCSKYHPQPSAIAQDLKQLFVTGMEEDVLEEQPNEDNQEKVVNKNYVKSKINEKTNFYQKGMYVKIKIGGLTYKSFSQINHSRPLILSRINLGQDNYGFIKVRFKRHRWYSNLLKSNDPIIVSSGWRRYQSLIVFATEDQNERLRYLKYTPQHDFCIAVFYGNFNQQNNNCVMTQTLRNNIKKFRIAGSGIILEINKSFQVMKKIKLIGEPYKIQKNTSFVRGMFNSAMEVSNYVGAQIKTVSGIRGQIKKAVKEGGQGTFRATFEDKILMSDIIFCRAWYRMKLQRFYNPILSFDKFRLMRTNYELRIDNNIQIEKKNDSEYKNIDRIPKSFKPFILPKKLEAKLPFKSLEKIKQSKKDKIRRSQSENIPKILTSEKERQVASLIQRLNTIKHHKMEKRQQKEKETKRLREAREKPKIEYYQKLKKAQKSEKMASLMRKKQKDNRKKQQE